MKRQKTAGSICFRLFFAGKEEILIIFAVVPSRGASLAPAGQFTAVRGENSLTRALLGRPHQSADWCGGFYCAAVGGFAALRIRCAPCRQKGDEVRLFISFRKYGRPRRPGRGRCSRARSGGHPRRRRRCPHRGGLSGCRRCPREPLPKPSA